MFLFYKKGCEVDFYSKSVILIDFFMSILNLFTSNVDFFIILVTLALVFGDRNFRALLILSNYFTETRTVF